MPPPHPPWLCESAQASESACSHRRDSGKERSRNPLSPFESQVSSRARRPCVESEFFPQSDRARGRRAWRWSRDAPTGRTSASSSRTPPRKSCGSVFSPENAVRARPDARTKPGEPIAPAAPEPHAIKTRDGWTLVAFRYRPSGPPRPGAMPVILCHGLTYNSTFWDLDPSCSLPRYLASQGFDVWTVDLRGCGASQKWVWKLDDAPTAVVDSALRRLSRGKLGTTSYATIDPKFANWTLDDHIALGRPGLGLSWSAGRPAPPRSPGSATRWVESSPSGHLPGTRTPGIGRLVTVGSQFTMPRGQLAVEFLREMIRPAPEATHRPARPRRPGREARPGVHNMFFNVRNVLPQGLPGPLRTRRPTSPSRASCSSTGRWRRRATCSTPGAVQLRQGTGQHHHPRLDQLRRRGPVRPAAGPAVPLSITSARPTRR